jgi:Mlc titration factor MtfA (ptsG expression regulator)
MAGLIRILRRRKLARRAIAESWLTILNAQVFFYQRLAGEDRTRFLQYLKTFVWEKHFIGVGGMEITDEVQVVIGACAVRLILNLGLSYYDRLTEIIVYPYVYSHRDDNRAILGEAQDWGTVVLSWPAVLQGLADPRDGHDTALHEFAHVLDRATGMFDGTPKLRSSEDYRPWAQIMSRHYLRLRRGVSTESDVLRSYGAVNESEFFAVATEVYFEKPHQLKKHLPDLYAELRGFYGGDPAAETEPRN